MIVNQSYLDITVQLTVQLDYIRETDNCMRQMHKTRLGQMTNSVKTLINDKNDVY